MKKISSIRFIKDNNAFAITGTFIIGIVCLIIFGIMAFFILSNIMEIATACLTMSIPLIIILALIVILKKQYSTKKDK